MIEIAADLHTHTSASAHAFSSLQEMCSAAHDAGLWGLAVTDHAPGVTDGVHRWHFSCLHELPRKIYGVTLIRGVELNIQPDGTLDLTDDILETLDFRIASMHHPTLERGRGREVNTRLWMAALDNPNVDCLGHCGNPAFDFDHDPVLRRCLETGRIVEINNHSFTSRPGSLENCKRIALRCMELGVKVAITSDAHFSAYVGRVSDAISMLEDIGFPQENIINSSIDRLRAYFIDRRGVDLFVE